MGERTGCREGFCAECVGIQSYCIIVISEQYTLDGLNLLSCPEAIFFSFSHSNWLPSCTVIVVSHSWKIIFVYAFHYILIRLFNPQQV